MTKVEHDELIALYKANRKAFSGFMSNVVNFFLDDNELLAGPSGRMTVHSIKSRMKDEAHLREKIRRKLDGGENLSSDNFFKRITDLAGVRVMHLKRSDFIVIHKAISDHVANLHWTFAEDPKAYTWDPEYKPFFDEIGIASELKDSFYTSVHYLVKPNKDTHVTCEIQVRTLFEEIWGEVDHELNYPKKTEIKSCSEQLKVLAKLVGAGTRLVDSIYASVEHE